MELRFFVPTEILMAGGCVEKNAEKLAALGKRALIVTGARSARENGAHDDLISALEKHGRSWAVFDKVMSNPTIDCIYEGAAAAKREKADFIIGVGGGSAMDAAKGIALLSHEPVPRENLFAGSYTGRLPLCCVPTTAGTGSEVTQYAILMNEQAQTKTSLSSPILFPDLALLDSRYLAFAPRNVMVNTVIDALSHSVEGYLSIKANAISDTLGLEAIRTIGALLTALENDRLSDTDREKLLYASMLGGMVIAHTGTTAVHCMGYSLTYFRGLDHGRANGLLLGEFLKFTEKTRPDRVLPLIDALGLQSTADFAGALDRLMGEKERLTLEETEKFSEIAITAKNIANCIVRPDQADLTRLYRLSFGL